ncbi:hypothetical protein BC833DRAFT_599868, partial [Globomyces pollinis-pini]
MGTEPVLVTFQVVLILHLVMGIVCIGVGTYFGYKYYWNVRKQHLIQISGLFLLDGMMLCVRFWMCVHDTTLVHIISNWMMFCVLILFAWIQMSMIHIICVAGTFIRREVVGYLRFVIVGMVVIGMWGEIFLHITFEHNDGTVADKWERYGSMVVVVVLQLFSLWEGVYMTMLMKSVSKTTKPGDALNNYIGYSRKATILLTIFVMAAVITSGLYLGMPKHGEVGTVQYMKYQNMMNSCSLMLSMQMISAALLFECIKCMKFGNLTKKSRPTQAPETTLHKNQQSSPKKKPF